MARNRRFSASAVIGLLNIMSQIITAQDSCLQTNSEDGLPYFQGYEHESGDPGAPANRIHHQHQAIIPSYKFNCCGNITEWGVDLNPDRDGTNQTFNFILQVWRPSPTMRNNCYSLVNDHRIASTTISVDLRVARVTTLPQEQLQFQPGDVLGFYVESHGSGSQPHGDDDNGVVLLNNGSHTSEFVWHGSITSRTSRSGSCPYPVGMDGVLTSATHAAPVISISAMVTTCLSSYSSWLDSITSTNLARMTVPTSKLSPSMGPNHTTVPGSRTTSKLSPSMGPNHTTVPGSNDGTISSGIITGIMVSIFVIVSIVSITVVIAVVIKRQGRTKQADNTEIAFSNQLYDTVKRDQVYATYESPDSFLSQESGAAQCHTEVAFYHSVGPNSAFRSTNDDNAGLYAVNPKNQVDHYAEIVTQYAEVDEKGQGKETPIWNNEYENSSHSKNQEAITTEIVRDDLFDVAGAYVPTTSERSNWEGHYETQNVNNHTYNKLTFFTEDPIYWAPASTTSDLYSQLASKKYREIPREQIRMLTELGSGEFGNVHKAVWSISGTTKEVAVKTLKPGSSENDRVRFLQEAAIMGQFNHPYVVKLYGVVTVEDPIIICFELMVNGNLRDHLGTLSPNNDVSMELELQLLKFSRQIASGMAYLSKKAFVHRDLAARNILLDEALTCKISDFGMARDLADSTYYTVQSKGGKIPVKWTAPEALFYKKYSSDSDVWSYGMVLFEIWSVGKKPFSEITNKEVLKKINSGYCQPPPPGCPRPIYQLMVNCWNPIHSQRPPFSKISSTLNASSSTLLQWTGGDCSVAGELGGQLSEAQFLYQDLQNSYLQ